jgi:hypothetical protein
LPYKVKTKKNPIKKINQWLEKSLGKQKGMQKKKPKDAQPARTKERRELIPFM